MKRCLLAAFALLAWCSLASADYIVIIANLNAPPDSGEGGTPGAGQVGGEPGGLGILGGLPGGQRGGGPGALGGMPGMRGGPPAGGGGAMLGGMPGMLGGMPGMRGGPPMGGGGLGFMGMPGTPGTPMIPGMTGSAAEEADDYADLVVAVLEVKSNLANYPKLFASGQGVRFTHKWGSLVVNAKGPQHEAILLEQGRGVPLDNVAKRFAQRTAKFKDAKEKPSAEALITEAQWALEHGLIKECADLLDKLVDVEKTHPVAAAYQGVKSELAKPMNKTDLASKWKSKLLDGYTLVQDDTHHFALLHNTGLKDLKPQMEQLENSFRAYYYWWALRSVSLPVAKDRPVAVMTAKADNEFKRLQSHLTASPVVADSFHARREGLSVFTNQRGDLVYDKLSRAAAPKWQAGFVPSELLTGIGTRGVPKEELKNALTPADKARVAAGPRTLAVLLKVLENEWEQTAITHEASREMLYASKLLPRNVHAPEWVQFGMGSFFETSLQSPWPSIGGANPYWLPRFKELQKAKKYEGTALETLKAVVTDSYFRAKVKGDKEDEIAKAKEINLRKARASSWALTYYLAKYQLPGLQRYFKELSRQPRDADLDEKALWAIFEKAFAGENLPALANRWLISMNTERLEAEEIHKKIRDAYAKMANPPKNPTRPGTPGQPGGAGGGGGGPGGSGQ